MHDYFVIAMGSSGDVHPMLALAVELQRRGGRVRLMTNPYFEAEVRSYGLQEFLPLQTREDFTTDLTNPDIWHPHRGFEYVVRRMILRSLPAIYEAIEEHHTPGQTTVVAPVTALGARVAREKFNLRLATIHLQPVATRSIDHPSRWPTGFDPARFPRWWRRLGFWLADRLYLDRILGSPLNQFRRELGLKPVKRVMERWWESPDLIIGLYPEWFAPPAPDWPPQKVLTDFPCFDANEFYQVSEQAKRFVLEGEPPLVFAPGTAMLHAHDFFQQSAEVARRLGRRAVLVTKFAEQIPKQLPQGVQHFDYIPFSWLFPRAAAIVHHGGIGTLSQAFAAGIPQLIRPLSHDQPDNAARIRRLGVGDEVWPSSYRAKRVAEKLSVLLESAEVRSACQEVASRFGDQQAVGLACDYLQNLGRDDVVAQPTPPEIGDPLAEPGDSLKATAEDPQVSSGCSEVKGSAALELDQSRWKTSSAANLGTS